jgi:hypothetical protein
MTYLIKPSKLEYFPDTCSSFFREVKMLECNATLFSKTNVCKYSGTPDKQPPSSKDRPPFKTMFSKTKLSTFIPK